MADSISGKTAQRIVEAISETCGYDINFISPKGYILASTDASRIDTYHEIGALAAEKRETFEVSDDTSLRGTRHGINVPLIFQGEVAGVIGITGDPEEVRQYAMLAQRMTILMLRERQLDRQHISRQYESEYVLRSLVSGKTLDYHYLEEFLTANHLSADSQFRIVLVRMNSRYHPGNLPMIEQELYDKVYRPLRCVSVQNYPGDYLILMENHVFSEKRSVFEEFAEKFMGILRVSAGEAGPVSALSKSFETAEIVLRSGEQGTLSVYEEQDLGIITGAVPKAVRKSFSEKILNTLGPEEKRLLRTYFSLNCSLKETSETLFIHKNTLQYKLQQIERKSGYEPRNFRDAVVLSMALTFEESSRSERIFS